ncbi:MAG: transglutaminase-like domain-containing protein [Ignavibacteria bacterium]
MTDLEEKVIHTKELDNLARLLDDEDENIYSNIKERFLSFGNNSSDFLKKYLDDENVLIKKRAKEIVSILNFETIAEKFRELSGNEDSDYLEDSMFLIASLGYPEIKMLDYKKKLENMALDIKARLNRIDPDQNNISSLEIINKINEYLFFEKGFIGNPENYYEPDNSFLNTVIDTKLGIPISLSVIYILIARKINIPITGVNLPGHFIIKYKKGSDEFFIDPFNKGVIISMKEATEFVKKIGMSKEDFHNIPYLKETTDTEIILRVMRNLVEIFKKNGDELRSVQLEKLMSILI